MEQIVCTIEKCWRKLTQLNEKHFAELVGLDNSVKKIYEKVEGDYENIIEYVRENLAETKKEFQEALGIITGLGDENYLPILRQNLIGTEEFAPVDSAAELYFARRSAAKQLYARLLSADNGTVFYCPKSDSDVELPPSKFPELLSALNHQLKSRRQAELTGISGFQDEDRWRILLHRPETFLADGIQHAMTGCAVMDFCPYTGEIRLSGVTQSWQCVNFTTLFGVIFFDNWQFFEHHKIYSLPAILNYGLAIPSVKSPVKKITAQTVSIISEVGIISHFPVTDSNHYLRLMFGRACDPNAGSEIYSITLKVIFAGKSGMVKVCPDRLESDLDDASLMFVEECLFAGKVLLISPDHPPRGKSFWRQMPFIAVQKSLCLDNWRRVLDGCVEFEAFQSAFLTPKTGFDNIAACRNPDCAEHCMTDVFNDGDDFFTICTKNPLKTTTVGFNEIELHEFNQQCFNRHLAEALDLSYDIRDIDRGIWRLGIMSFGKIRKCDIYLSCVPSEQLINAVLKICLTTENPAIILSVVTGNFSHEESILMAKHRVVCLSLGDWIGFDFNCRFSVSDMLATEIKKHLPADRGLHKVIPIPLPHGTRWEDVTFKFKDNHTLVCIIGGQGTVRGFWDCGMVDHRTGQPDRNWHLLLALAGIKGNWPLDWQNTTKAMREQQRKRQLCSALKKLLNIPGDPIVFNRDDIRYHCLFKFCD